MEVSNENKEQRKEQYKMHKDFFDRAENAIDKGYYLEAIFLEYAAIEGRLEVILGLFSCPCNKDIPSNQRTKINISHRITCLKKLMKNSNHFETSKLNLQFFKGLDNWIKTRNQYIHGLYKNSSEYCHRTTEAKRLSESGLEFARMFYNEAKRLRRRIKEGQQFLDYDGEHCFSKKCSLSQELE